MHGLASSLLTAYLPLLPCHCCHSVHINAPKCSSLELLAVSRFGHVGESSIINIADRNMGYFQIVIVPGNLRATYIFLPFCNSIGGRAF
jgi:hypothetical protein